MSADKKQQILREIAVDFLGYNTDSVALEKRLEAMIQDPQMTDDQRVECAYSTLQDFVQQPPKMQNLNDMVKLICLDTSLSDEAKIQKIDQLIQQNHYSGQAALDQQQYDRIIKKRIVPPKKLLEAIMEQAEFQLENSEAKQPLLENQIQQILSEPSLSMQQKQEMLAQMILQLAQSKGLNISLSEAQELANKVLKYFQECQSVEKILMWLNEVWSIIQKNEPNIDDGQRNADSNRALNTDVNEKPNSYKKRELLWKQKDQQQEQVQNALNTKLMAIIQDRSIKPQERNQVITNQLLRQYPHLKDQREAIQQYVNQILGKNQTVSKEQISELQAAIFDLDLAQEINKRSVPIQNFIQKIQNPENQIIEHDNLMSLLKENEISPEQYDVITEIINDPTLSGPEKRKNITKVIIDEPPADQEEKLSEIINSLLDREYQDGEELADAISNVVDSLNCINPQETAQKLWNVITNPSKGNNQKAELLHDVLWDAKNSQQKAEENFISDIAATIVTGNLKDQQNALNTAVQFLDTFDDDQKSSFAQNIQNIVNHPEIDEREKAQLIADQLQEAVQTNRQIQRDILANNFTQEIENLTNDDQAHGIEEIVEKLSNVLPAKYSRNLPDLIQIIYNDSPSDSKEALEQTALLIRDENLAEALNNVLNDENLDQASKGRIIKEMIQRAQTQACYNLALKSPQQRSPQSERGQQLINKKIFTILSSLAPSVSRTVISDTIRAMTSNADMLHKLETLEQVGFDKITGLSDVVTNILSNPKVDSRQKALQIQEIVETLLSRYDQVREGGNFESDSAFGVAKRGFTLKDTIKPNEGKSVRLPPQPQHTEGTAIGGQAPSNRMQNGPTSLDQAFLLDSHHQTLVDQPQFAISDKDLPVRGLPDSNRSPNTVFQRNIEGISQKYIGLIDQSKATEEDHQPFDQAFQSIKGHQGEGGENQGKGFSFSESREHDSGQNDNRIIGDRHQKGTRPMTESSKMEISQALHEILNEADINESDFKKYQAIVENDPNLIAEIKRMKAAVGDERNAHKKDIVSYFSRLRSKSGDRLQRNPTIWSKDGKFVPHGPLDDAKKEQYAEFLAEAVPEIQISEAVMTDLVKIINDELPRENKNNQQVLESLGNNPEFIKKSIQILNSPNLKPEEQQAAISELIQAIASPIIAQREEEQEEKTHQMADLIEQIITKPETIADNIDVYLSEFAGSIPPDQMQDLHDNLSRLIANKDIASDLKKDILLETWLANQNIQDNGENKIIEQQNLAQQLIDVVSSQQRPDRLQQRAKSYVGKLKAFNQSVDEPATDDISPRKLKETLDSVINNEQLTFDQTEMILKDALGDQFIKDNPQSAQELIRIVTDKNISVQEKERKIDQFLKKNQQQLSDDQMNRHIADAVLQAIEKSYDIPDYSATKQQVVVIANTHSLSAEERTQAILDLIEKREQNAGDSDEIKVSRNADLQSELENIFQKDMIRREKRFSSLRISGPESRNRDIDGGEESDEQNVSFSKQNHHSAETLQDTKMPGSYRNRNADKNKVPNDKDTNRWNFFEEINAGLLDNNISNEAKMARVVNEYAKAGFGDMPIELQNELKDVMNRSDITPEEKIQVLESIVSYNLQPEAEQERLRLEQFVQKIANDIDLILKNYDLTDNQKVQLISEYLTNVIPNMDSETLSQLINQFLVPGLSMETKQALIQGALLMQDEKNQLEARQQTLLMINNSLQQENIPLPEKIQQIQEILENEYGLSELAPDIIHTLETIANDPNIDDHERAVQATDFISWLADKCLNDDLTAISVGQKEVQKRFQFQQAIDQILALQNVSPSQRKALAKNTIASHFTDPATIKAANDFIDEYMNEGISSEERRDIVKQLATLYNTDHDAQVDHNDEQNEKRRQNIQKIENIAEMGYNPENIDEIVSILLSNVKLSSDEADEIKFMAQNIIANEDLDPQAKTAELAKLYDRIQHQSPFYGYAIPLRDQTGKRWIAQKLRYRSLTKKTVVFPSSNRLDGKSVAGKLADEIRKAWERLNQVESKLRKLANEPRMTREDKTAVILRELRDALPETIGQAVIGQVEHLLRKTNIDVPQILDQAFRLIDDLQTNISISGEGNIIETIMQDSTLSPQSKKAKIANLLNCILPGHEAQEALNLLNISRDAFDVFSPIKSLNHHIDNQNQKQLFQQHQDDRDNQQMASQNERFTRLVEQFKDQPPNVAQQAAQQIIQIEKTKYLSEPQKEQLIAQVYSRLGYDSVNRSANQIRDTDTQSASANPGFLTPTRVTTQLHGIFDPSDPRRMQQKNEKNERWRSQEDSVEILKRISRDGRLSTQAEQPQHNHSFSDLHLPDNEPSSPKFVVNVNRADEYDVQDRDLQLNRLGDVENSLREVLMKGEISLEEKKTLLNALTQDNNIDDERRQKLIDLLLDHNIQAYDKELIAKRLAQNNPNLKEGGDRKRVLLEVLEDQMNNDVRLQLIREFCQVKTSQSEPPSEKPKSWLSESYILENQHLDNLLKAKSIKEKTLIINKLMQKISIGSSPHSSDWRNRSLNPGATSRSVLIGLGYGYSQRPRNNDMNILLNRSDIVQRAAADFDDGQIIEDNQAFPVNPSLSFALYGQNTSGEQNRDKL